MKQPRSAAVRMTDASHDMRRWHLSDFWCYLPGGCR